MSHQQVKNDSHSDETKSTPELERESFEEWASRSKQIEAERQKAIKALEEEKPSQANLAFLDPKTTKVKGWSKDSDVIFADSEQMGDRALILALSDVILGLISYVGRDTGYFASILNGLGYICLGVAALLGLVVTGMELYWGISQKKKLTLSFWTGLSAVLVVIIYVVVKLFLF